MRDLANEIAEALGWEHHELPYGSVFEDQDGERRGWPEAMAALRARRDAMREKDNEIAQLRAEVECLRAEVERLKDTTGWREYERVRLKLGEIISDHYAERSMWPRLDRVERWYADMETRAEAAETRVARLAEALEECVVTMGHSRVFVTPRRLQGGSEMSEKNKYKCRRARQIARALSRAARSTNGRRSTMPHAADVCPKCRANTLDGEAVGPHTCLYPEMCHYEEGRRAEVERLSRENQRLREFIRDRVRDSADYLYGLQDEADNLLEELKHGDGGKEYGSGDLSRPR